MNELRWVSAAEQRRLLDAGEVAAAELHRLSIATIERLNPELNAVVIPLFERGGGGVPILLKDAGQELAGTPHWCGVAALRDVDARSPSTTVFAAQLEQRGLSIIGKGACPELSGGATTEPPGFAPTRNPWDPTVSAGGSSGGPAAAVASGMVALAHGSDATGSIRCPAALCGLATLKPTSGRIPSMSAGGQPAGDAWCDFVLSRHVEDLVDVFGTVADDAGVLRVGLLDHDPELGLGLDAACVEGVHVTARLLESLGHRVDVGWPPALDHLWASASAHFGVVSDAVRPDSVRWVETRLGRPVVRGDLSQGILDAAERAATRTADEVARAIDALAAAFAEVPSWWDDHDVLVTPTTFRQSWKLGGTPGPREMGTLVAPFSMTGQPALSLPLHWTEDGLPVGVQLVGRRGADEVLLRLALDLQSAADWRHRRPVVR